MRRLICATLLVWLAVALPPASLVAQEPAATPAASATPEDTPNAAPTSFFEIVFSGGVTGILIMSALIGLSIAAVALVIEHSLTIRQPLLMPPGLAEEVRQAIRSGNLAQAEQLCQQAPSFLAFVLQAGLAEVEGGWPAIEKGMEDATAEQAARLFRKIEFLPVIGNIAPMLGLLGTVTGMIIAFKEVAESQGGAQAPQLAEGIYQALVTTVAGLVIAIPSLGAFAIFRNRVDQLIAEAAYMALHTLGPLKRAQFQPTSAVVPPPPPVGKR